MGAGYLSHLGHIIVFQIAEILSRFERKGFKLVAIKIVVPSKGFAEKHYHDLKERPFFNGLCDFLSSGPVIAMVRRTITLILISTTTLSCWTLILLTPSTGLGRWGSDQVWSKADWSYRSTEIWTWNHQRWSCCCSWKVLVWTIHSFCYLQFHYLVFRLLNIPFKLLGLTLK